MRARVKLRLKKPLKIAGCASWVEGGLAPCEHQAGEEVSVHPTYARSLVASGYAEPI
jgi:hypothetical protein